MKTGRPEYRLPSLATVARDVKHVFVNMQSQLAAKLKVTFHMTQTNVAMLKTKHRHTMVDTGSWNEASSYALWTRVSSGTGQRYLSDSITVHLIDGCAHD
jgi:hypothetical protein